MRITVLVENLQRTLGVVGRSVASRPQLPVLANVLLRAGKKGLEALSTDLEMGFRVRVGAKVEEEGEVSVSGKVLGELVATLPGGAVELETEKEALVVKMGGVRAQVPGIAAGEFPVLAEFEGAADVVIEKEKLAVAVERVGLAAARDDARPVLTGVAWKWGGKGKKMGLAATDGYRLSVDEVEVEKVREGAKLKEVVVPARAMVELMRVVEKGEEGRVELKWETDKQQVLFRVGEVELVSRLLAGEFPPYEQIMPREWASRMVVGTAELTEAVRRAAIFAREAANIVRWEVAEGEVKVSANSAQVGSSETVVAAETEGEKLKVAFNSRYLLEYLAVVGGEKVVFESGGSLKPGVFGEEKKGWVHVIMPVRVQE